MLGGGQLGRMTALAAARLGYKLHVFSPEPDGPAAQVAHRSTVAAYDDEDALEAFARAVDVVTLEFENLPPAALELIQRIVPVHPSAQVLRVTQDRLEEKTFARRLGIETAPFAGVDSQGDLEKAVAMIAPPAILKTRRFGYDGKGQARLERREDAARAWRAIGEAPAILEGFVDFALELSVIVARGQDGAVRAYPAVENRHCHHILATTIAPAAIPAAAAKEAERIAVALAQGLDVVGLLAVEMFMTPDGRVLMNEMAPRPHNSGHWTIDACPTSQFEQLVRVAAGLPLGPVEPYTPALMTNLIGHDVDAWPRLVADPTARLHLYGKAEVRPGRKMGHVTRLKRQP
ncbi:MAG: 5-(carboxyamino)imidazole ribonucleotide synthase [Proteobacteria bacterium]|nr:5-(carboxyamino)imidazole ribonucleotide synthase [Pseudomonadota bacterium]